MGEVHVQALPEMQSLRCLLQDMPDTTTVTGMCRHLKARNVLLKCGGKDSRGVFATVIGAVRLRSAKRLHVLQLVQCK